MSSIYRSSSRMKRKSVNNYHIGSSAEEERLLKQAIELSKVDHHRGGLSVPFGPTFYPTIEEFEQGPVAYVDKIRSIAEKYGIAKVVPPKGWSPPFCVDMNSNKRFQTKKQVVQRLQEGIAFDDGEEYNPSEYMKMANEFTMRWREKHYSNDSSNKSVDGDSNKKKMTYHNLEQDYWNLVETNMEEVEVEYGNDIDTSAYWSGFPLSERGRCTAVKKRSKVKNIVRLDEEDEPKFGTDEFYKESWWNVNNIANSPGTALCKVKVGINGINVPWLYFGSLFTTFCWHNEDNYLYSINYHHKGAPKLWYGVPGTRKDAEGLERVFKNYLSMKMRDVPDLLHHITTMFSPRLLQQGGVPACKLLQHSGEYIITFPRSFHGGFSLGPNIGEAVNFATNDWLMHGADASERYRSFSRASVFSHDRLTMTMANHLKDQRTSTNCMLLYKELQRIINEELCSRRELVESGVRDISNEVSLPKNRYDQLDNDSADYDDKRLCYSCKHVCFFSAVACECSQSKVSCLRHSHYMCRCSVDKKYLLIWSKKKELVDTLESVRKHWERLRAHEEKSKMGPVTPTKSSIDDPSENTRNQNEFDNDIATLPVVIKSEPSPAMQTFKSNEILSHYHLPNVTSDYSVLSSNTKKVRLSNGLETNTSNSYIQMGANKLERKMGLSTSPLTTISSNEI